MLDVLPCAAMGPPGGARNNVDPRVISLYNMFEIQFPAMESLETIYETILTSHLATLAEDIQTAAGPITSTTLALYQYICDKLPPTPSRFHYIFNLRDLSRIYEGMLLSVPDTFTTGAEFVRLWRHECLRIFHDRLISTEDKELMIARLGELVNERFASVGEAVLADPILFGDYRNSMKEAEAQLYEDLKDFASVKPIFEEVLEEYNMKKKNMNLVFFEDALDHLTRIHRVVRRLCTAGSAISL